MRAVLLIPLLLAGCDNMVKQPRYDPYGAGPLFADGKAMQLPPAGTVARDAPEWAEQAKLPPLTANLLARGQERYGIYCAMCHGLDGSGDGTVPARGFPRPADFHAADQRALDSASLYRTISDGSGVMYGFRDRVPPRDRWAIAAYVQALQRVGRR